MKVNVKAKSRWDMRHLYDDIIAVVQDNGQVTLPASASARFLAKRRRRVALLLAGIVIFVARSIAPGLSERLGQQVVVDNRSGASTMIGGELAAKAPPDGYTLMMAISTLAINPATFKHVPYDALRDFVPITHAAVQPLLLVTHPSFPAKTAMELIALAKARPGDITFSSPGFGTNPEISARLANDGAEVIASTPEEFGAYIRAETEKWAKVVKAAGIKPE